MDALTFHPLTPERWPDLERLFGPERGANSGCWCMWWRVTRSEWEAMGRDRRKAAFKEIVKSGAVPGILAYDGDRPVGWCAVAPRSEFPSLDRSPVAKPVDDGVDGGNPPWSINCFFIDRHYRRKGVMTALIEAAVAHAGRAGARVVEAYPLDPTREVQRGDAFFGLATAFRDCGFAEVARRRPTRPFMRRVIG